MSLQTYANLKLLLSTYTMRTCMHMNCLIDDNFSLLIKL